MSFVEETAANRAQGCSLGGNTLHRCPSGVKSAFWLNRVLRCGPSRMEGGTIPGLWVKGFLGCFESLKDFKNLGGFRTFNSKT